MAACERLTIFMLQPKSTGARNALVAGARHSSECSAKCRAGAGRARGADSGGGRARRRRWRSPERRRGGGRACRPAGVWRRHRVPVARGARAAGRRRRRRQRGRWGAQGGPAGAAAAAATAAAPWRWRLRAQPRARLRRCGLFFWPVSSLMRSCPGQNLLHEPGGLCAGSPPDSELQHQAPPAAQLTP